MSISKISLLFCILIFGTQLATAEEFTTPKPGSALRKEVLNAFRNPIENDLNQKVLFKVNDLRVSGRWAFINAQTLTPAQNEIDYTKTKYAEDVREGFFDDWICALAEKVGGKWKVHVFIIGATDVPYVAWPETYGVPRDIVMGRQ